jgi:hypothetical protein
MGFGLHVEFTPSVDDGPDFIHWSSKGMLDALAMGYEVFGFGSILDSVAQELNLDVSPLHKVTNPELGIEDFIAEIPPDQKEEIARWTQRYREFDERRTQSWQSPKRLRESLEALIHGLDENPDIYERVNVDPDRYGMYYISGVFRRELDHLLKIISWAEAEDIPRIRLIWF